MAGDPPARRGRCNGASFTPDPAQWCLNRLCPSRTDTTSTAVSSRIRRVVSHRLQPLGPQSKRRRRGPHQRSDIQMDGRVLPPQSPAEPVARHRGRRVGIEGSTVGTASPKPGAGLIWSISSKTLRTIASRPRGGRQAVIPENLDSHRNSGIFGLTHPEFHPP